MDDLFDWYARLWRVETPDSDLDIATAERRLGLTLPRLLRALYTRTSMRDSEMLHVEPLDRLSLTAGGLVFATEQQAAWSWAIPRAALDRADPELVFGHGDEWMADTCTLAAFIRYYAVANRPHREPNCDGSDFAPTRLVAPWAKVQIEWRSIQHDDLWCNGEAVLDEHLLLLGARDAQALRRAAGSLDVDLE